MSALDPETIAQLLKEDEEKPRGGSRGPRVDPTEVREINVWFKLDHHICTPDCPHRQENPAGEDKACWNIDCKDPRNDDPDKMANMVVAQVKKQLICRYCFLQGYLK